MGIVRYKPKEKNIIKLKQYLNGKYDRLGENHTATVIGETQQQPIVGDVYIVESMTSDLEQESADIREQHNDYTTIREYTMSLLQKASIITTPTAYLRTTYIL